MVREPNTYKLRDISGLLGVYIYVLPSLFHVYAVLSLCTWNDASQTWSQHSMYGVCYYMRFNTWQCVSARLTGYVDEEQEEDDEKRKKGTSSI